MNPTLKKIFFFLILCFFLLPFSARTITFEPPFQLPAFGEIISAIIDFISLAAFAIAPIAIIIAAFYFLTSGGDPEKVRTAKRIIFFTIIGLIIILLVRGLPTIIEQIIVGPPGPPPTCGNGTIEPGEECDGANFGGNTCITLGFVGGVLTCNPGCTFNTSGCISPSPNFPPIADARVGSAPNPTGKSITVTAGATVYFDGSTFSSDPDGTITKYEWDFNNNGIYDWSSGVTGVITRVYSSGSYTARLRVTDDDGATATDTVSITVNPAPVLTASIVSPPNGQIFLQGTSVTFTGLVSGGVTPYSYNWSSNLGGVIGNTLTFNKNNLSVGVHTITFRVTDSASIPVTASSTITITITNDVTPPTIQNAKVNPTSGPPGTVFTIAADITDPLGVNPNTTIAHIQNPDETDVAQVTLYDDGLHNDGAAGDGTYGNSWNSTGFPSGAYYVDIIACDLIGNCAEKENI